jgi:DNA polymerase
VPGYGDVRAGLAFIGEAPGKVEDKNGRPFTGSAGQCARDIMALMDIDPDQCWWSNVYHCRPPRNDVSLAADSPCPTIWLMSELQRLNELRVIVALGRTALTFFRPETEPVPMKTLALQDVKWTVPRTKNEVTVVGAFHPAAILYSGGPKGGNEKFVSFVYSLIRARGYLGEDTPTVERIDE